MFKNLVVALTVLLTVGCNDTHADDPHHKSRAARSELTVVCLDGVQYYTKHYVLTPVVDSTTLNSFKGCKI